MSTNDDFRPDDKELEDDEKIELGFTQMEMLYRSRCIQSPLGTNVVVREIEKDD
ncbi:MAG: hypothetical protein ACI8ZB_000011 [Desulforhopalus sp.]|jgi:hypothetical protein